MKPDRAEAPAWRMYPHIVVRQGARDVRLDMHVTNAPLGEDRAGWHAAYAFSRPGAIDEAGKVTAIGRAVILEQLRERMHHDDERCVVWGPRSCTWVSRASVIDGVDPPFGDPSDVNAVARLSPVLLEGVWIELPAGAAASHLFFRRLAFDRVEISTAAPLVLADLNEPLRAGEPDAFEDWFDEDEAFAPKAYFRGDDVLGVDGSNLLGPVQPDGNASRLVRPWPSAVRAACLELAGRPLPATAFLAVWHEIEGIEGPPIVSGSRRVA